MLPTLQAHQDCLILTFNRPEALNALSFSILDHLVKLLQEVKKSSARALIITGSGDKAFCAGADIKELFDIVTSLRDANGQIPAVSVAKNKARFEWASVMVFNCEHPDNRVLTPDFIQNTDKGLHGIAWTNSIGGLPDDWNHLVGYDELRQVRVSSSASAEGETAQSTDLAPGKSHAKLIHFTQGVPAWPITADCEYAEQWDLDKQFMNSAQDWEKLMGHSVHSAKLPDGKVVPKYKLNAIQP